MASKKSNVLNVKAGRVTVKNIKKKTEVMDLIIENTKADVEWFEGKPFTGHNVATYFGRVCAAVTTLATTQKAILEEIEKIEKWRRGNG